MSERAANDTETPARTALEVYIIDPSSKLPTTPGAPSDGATGTKQDQQIELLEDIADAATNQDPVGVWLSQDDYEVVGASADDQILGATGASGDYIAALVIQPATTSPGEVTLKDDATTVYSWPGTSSYPEDLRPLIVPLGVKSKNGAWKLTTGANVGVLPLGDFT